MAGPIEGEEALSFLIAISVHPQIILRWFLTGLLREIFILMFA